MLFCSSTVRPAPWTWVGFDQVDARRSSGDAISRMFQLAREVSQTKHNVISIAMRNVLTLTLTFSGPNALARDRSPVPDAPSLLSYRSYRQYSLRTCVFRRAASDWPAAPAPARV